MKILLKNLLALLGLKIQRIDTPTRSLDRGLLALKKRIRVASVIDIGVAYGTPDLYKHFPASEHKYLLVEADVRHIDSVRRLAEKLGARYEMVFCGAQSEERTFYLSNDLEKSSGYPRAQHKTSHNVTKVRQETLDTLVTRNGLKGPYFIKIDVEGAQMDVLKGASDTLKGTAAVLLEVNLQKTYANGSQFSDLVSFMRANNFELIDILAGANRDNQLFQMDVVFAPIGTKRD